ncbi:hypothetical protein DIPPA_54499 [Diplonema papillatum]|nr:hypothetical protein DIPPA_54499 [Diplonema papillatum]
MAPADTSLQSATDDATTFSNCGVLAHVLLPLITEISKNQVESAPIEQGCVAVSLGSKLISVSVVQVSYLPDSASGTTTKYHVLRAASS